MCHLKKCKCKESQDRPPKDRDIRNNRIQCAICDGYRRYDMQEGRLSEKEVAIRIRSILACIELSEEDKNTLTQALEIVEAMEKAEVPEKKDIAGMINIFGKGSPDVCIALGRNEAIDDCKPIIAKQQLDIVNLHKEINDLKADKGELKQWIKELEVKREGLIDCCSTRDYAIDEYKKENTSLKQELEKIKNKDFGIAQLITENNELKQRVKELEESLDTSVIEKKITDYFVLSKRWLRKRNRHILFGEDDSRRLAKAIAGDNHPKGGSGK